MLLPFVKEFCSQSGFGGLVRITRDSHLVFEGNGGDGRCARGCSLEKLPAVRSHGVALQSVKIVKFYLDFAMDCPSCVLV